MKTPTRRCLFFWLLLSYLAVAASVLFAAEPQPGQNRRLAQGASEQTAVPSGPRPHPPPPLGEGRGGGPDISDLRDITGPEALPPPPGRLWWPVWLCLALVFCASLLGVLWKLTRNIRQAPALSSDQWALGELDRIESLALPAAGQVERYHTLLSDVMRRYLELRFQLHAPQQSTEEFLETMRAAPSLSASQQALLRDFLARCDLAKFARAGFSSDECHTLARMAREFVEQTAAGPSS